MYLRKSRADEELESINKMETLARHEKTLLAYAKKNHFSITKIYKEVVSGETISSRPEVQKLLQDVENGKFAGILVMEVERLARGDTIDQGIVARTFKNGNTKIITPIKTYDPNNEFDEEYFEFGLFMSRREYKTINRRIQRGRIASAKEGKSIVSVAPYGYTKSKLKNEKGYTLQINEQEANVVKLIYNFYNSGLGMEMIATRLDGMKIIPRYTKTWSKSTINDILKNPVYIGKIRWGFRQEKKIQKIDESIIKRIKNENCILTDGRHPAIISEDEFDKAQKMRKMNTKKCTKKNLSLKNPLAGLIYCKKCGSLMTRLGENSKTPYATLKCPNKYCNNISAPIFLIEKNLISSIKSKLSNHMLLNIEFEDNFNVNDQIRELNGLLKKLENDLGKIDLQISKTYDLLETGIYDTETFTDRNHKLSERKSGILNDINSIKNQTSELQYENKREEILIPRFLDLLSVYENTHDISTKNMILKKIVQRVDYLKTQPNHKGKLNNDNFTLEITTKLL